MKRCDKMWVVTVDKYGHELGDGHWVTSPLPDSYAANGFHQIEIYVRRLMESTAPYTSLIIGTPDGMIAVLLSQRAGAAEFNVSVEWRDEPEKERAIRQFFADRALPPFHDYLAGNGGVRDATRCLDYILPPDVGLITAVIKDFLRDIDGLLEQDALNFSFNRHKAPSNR